MSNSNLSNSGQTTQNQITVEQIKHMAELSRLGITDLEAEKYAQQMNGIVEYMGILSEVNVEGVEMTNQVTGLQSVLRDDQVVDFAKKDQLLDCSALPKINNQIAVKAVIKED